MLSKLPFFAVPKFTINKDRYFIDAMEAHVKAVSEKPHQKNAGKPKKGTKIMANAQTDHSKQARASSSAEYRKKVREFGKAFVADLLDYPNPPHYVPLLKEVVEQTGSNTAALKYLLDLYAQSKPKN